MHGNETKLSYYLMPIFTLFKIRVTDLLVCQISFLVLEIHILHFVLLYFGGMMGNGLCV